MDTNHYTSEEWADLLNHVYALLVREMEDASKSDSLEALYPSLVAGYEFFRRLRGEGFHAARPNDLGETQKEFYKMEDDLAKRLKELSQKLDPSDSKTKFYLDQAKKLFDVPF